MLGCSRMIPSTPPAALVRLSDSTWTLSMAPPLASDLPLCEASKQSPRREAASAAEGQHFALNPAGSLTFQRLSAGAPGGTHGVSAPRARTNLYEGRYFCNPSGAAGPGSA